MALTLANDLTGLVSREVDAAERTTSGLGESLATGNDKFVEVVDSFLGNSLRDSEIILSAIAKNTAYSINMLAITDEYLTTISKSLQEGLKTIGSAGPLSADKLAVLQKNLNDKREQVALLIKTADFDGKKLLGGGAEAINVQVGLSVTDKITLRVTDLEGGKLFRTSINKAMGDHIVLNKALAAANANGTTYYTTSAQIDTAVINNDNLIFDAINVSATGNGSALALAAGATVNEVIRLTAAMSGAANTAAAAAILALSSDAGAAAIAANAAVTGAADGAAAAAAALVLANTAADTYRMTSAQLGEAIASLTPAQKTLLDQMAPLASAALTANNAGVTFVNATAANISAVYDNGGVLATPVVPVAGAAYSIGQGMYELRALLQDNVTTDISDPASQTSKVIAQDVFTNALHTIRAEQATISNQKSNVIEAADALRATTNVTQKAADSYLKTDYVITAQRYAETIRTMVAAITALQAANKVPEAAQRLIDSLAR